MHHGIKRLVLSGAAACLAFGLMSGMASAAPVTSAVRPATAQAPSPAVHAFINKETGKCIGGSHLLGDFKCHFGYGFGYNQMWRWGAYAHGGWRRLINLNGKCMAVQGGSKALGARIVAESCAGAPPRQYWGTYGTPEYNLTYLVNYKSRYVIAVANGSKANGAKLWQSKMTPGHTNQYWLAYLVPGIPCC
jgi:hypothetical protein